MLMVLLATAGAWADDISQEKAQEIAAQAMARICGRQTMASRAGRGVSVKQPKPVLAYTARAAQAEQNDFYVFNNGDSEGFVIVSGNDATIDPVLGFSDSGTFDYDDAPESLKALLRQYSAQIDYLRTSPSDKAQSIMARIIRRATPYYGNVVVAPLVTTTWNQFTPYNNLCPKIDGENPTLTGCTATAMAQVMNYWKWPARGHGSVSYFWNPTMNTRYDYAVDFNNSVYDWANMLDNYTSGAYTEQQGESVALLMRDVGAAIQSSYGYEGTFVSLDPVAMAKNFSYDADSLKVIGRILLHSVAGDTDDFDSYLKKELDVKRPVLLAANPAKGIILHTIVVDGYTDTDYFHMNFGWGGQSDGYFLTKLIDVSAKSVESRYMRDLLDMDAMIGICPARTVDHDGVSYTFHDGEASVYAITKLGDVVIPDHVADANGVSCPVTGVSTWACYENDSVTTIQLPETVRKFGNMSFVNATKLTTINIPGAVKTVPSGSFSGCTSLSKVTLSEGITEIDSQCFYDCKSLRSMTLPNSLVAIRDSAFMECSALSSVGSGSPTVIGSYAFASCGELMFFEWKSVKEIGTSAFAGCTWIRPDVKGVLKLGDTVFGSSSNYSRIEFDSLQVLGRASFMCSELRLGAHAMPEDLTGLQAALTKIEIDPANGKYTVVDNIIYTKDMRSLVYSANRYNDGYLGEVDRKELIVPEGVERIECQSVRGGSRLNNVTLPASVTEIDTLAFYNCTSLYHLYNYAVTPQPLKGNIFYSNPRVHVPIGSKEAYMQAEVWKDMDIVEDLPVPIEEDEEVIDVETEEAKVNAVRIYWLREPKYLTQVAVELVFPSMPKLSYEDGYDDEQHVGRNVVLTSAEGISIKVYGQTYVYDQVTFPHAGYKAVLGKLEFYYDEAAAAAGIDTPSRPDNGIRLQIDRSCVTLSGLAQGTMVTLYTLDGQTVASAKATASGNAVISLPEKGSTAYILKAGESTFKIGVK